MNIDQLAALGELMGGIGVLGTLIYLAIEVRNNSKLLRINAQSSGMESFAGYNEGVARDRELIELFDRILGGEAFQSLSSVEQFKLTLAIRALIQRMEAQYFQYKGGLIDENYWIQRMRWLNGLLSLPSLDNWWEVEAKSAHVTDEFVTHVNSVEHSMKMGQAGQVREDT